MKFSSPNGPTGSFFSQKKKYVKKNWYGVPRFRDLRRVLRYRNMSVREAVKMKNKTAGLLMEVGAEYSKKRLHQKGYFRDLMEN
jgi:hypothetical protein